MAFLYWYELKTRTSTNLSNCNPLGLAEGLRSFLIIKQILYFTRGTRALAKGTSLAVDFKPLTLAPAGVYCKK